MEKISLSWIMHVVLDSFRIACWSKAASRRLVRVCFPLLVRSSHQLASAVGVDVSTGMVEEFNKKASTDIRRTVLRYKSDNYAFFRPRRRGSKPDRLTQLRSSTMDYKQAWMASCLMW